MEKEENYTENIPASFASLEYSMDQQQQHIMKQRSLGESSGDNNNGLVDYMLNNVQHQHEISTNSASLERLSFADVMQFADFGPKLALNHTKISEEDNNIDDPVYFLKFPVLNDRMDEQTSFIIPEHNERFKAVNQENKAIVGGDNRPVEDEEARVSDSMSLQPRFLGGDPMKNIPAPEVKNKRKRPRSMKTSEEVESQRMTHIAVERNRRKQMNEHLRVLRSLMPGSYVQRGDQASIIGGAIEFVRELEQLLQCLESQKRRRLFGDAPRQMGGDSSIAIQQPQQPQLMPPLSLPNEQMKLLEFDDGLREETAENKSCLADIEVKLLGFDAVIKILSRRRPGQLIKTIAAIEDLQLNILHTNITTIEQTVLYTFNVKISSESGFSAEDIASSVQQIFSFIHANTSM